VPDRPSAGPWRRLSGAALREHLHLIFADLRHFADPRDFASADPSFRPEQISIETYADDIEQARQALGLGEVVVIGHSNHGKARIHWPVAWPERYEGPRGMSRGPSLSYSGRFVRPWRSGQWAACRPPAGFSPAA